MSGAGGATRESAGVTAMVAATALWGATFVVIRDTLAHIDPYALVFVRFAIAGTLFAAILAWRRTVPNRAAIAGGAVTGVLSAAGYLFQAIGLTSTSAGSSAFLTCAGTLFAGFAAWPLLGQRPRPRLVAGITLAVAGAALLTLRDRFQLGAGELWTLLGAVAYAVQIVMVARFLPRTDPLSLVTVQSIAVAVVLWPLAQNGLGAVPLLAPSAWLGIGYLALAGSLVAPLLQVWSQRALPPGRVGLLFALEPVFALVFALTLGGERFAWRWWWGASLILAAVVLVEWPEVMKERRARGEQRDAGAPD